MLSPGSNSHGHLHLSCQSWLFVNTLKRGLSPIEGAGGGPSTLTWDINHFTSNPGSTWFHPSSVWSSARVDRMRKASWRGYPIYASMYAGVKPSNAAAALGTSILLWVAPHSCCVWEPPVSDPSHPCWWEWALFWCVELDLVSLFVQPVIGALLEWVNICLTIPEKVHTREVYVSSFAKV